MGLTTRLRRQRLGFVMVFTMLFFQPALLWAQTLMPGQSQQPAQHSCHQHQQVAQHDSATPHCQHDRHQHEHSCASQCYSHCLSTGISSVPVSAHNLLPFFRASAVYHSAVIQPDGADTRVLDRPPRHPI